MADAEALEHPTIGRPPRSSEVPAEAGTPQGVAPHSAGVGEGEGAVMSLVEHLAELRRRVLIALLALVLASGVGWFLGPQILDLLIAPLGQQLFFIGPSDAFVIRLKIAFVFGLLVAMPVFLLEAWRFVSPGLTLRERALARPWLPLAYLFFLVGVAAAYLVLPFAVGFLLSFAEEGVLEPLITASEYFGFVISLVLAFGLVLQYPLVVAFLAEVGVIGSERLRSSRRYVFLAIAVFAAVATPGGDIISPVALGAVMYALYELTVQIVRWRGH